MSTPTMEQTVPPAVAKAQAVVDKWTAKASAAREEAEQVDRESGAQILENPNAAEKITTKVLTLERQARAYDSAATEAKAQVRAAWRNAVEAEAKELEKSVVTMRRDAEKHRGKVDALLSQLKDLDGVDYVPHLGHAAYEERGTYYSADDSPRETKSQDLEARAAGAESQAALVRHVLATGDVNSFPGAPLIGYLTTPPVTQAAIDAGAL